MTDAELHAEAKRRAQRAMPSLTDGQWNQWLANALRNGASIVLIPDGALAAYPRADAQGNAGGAR